MVTSNENDSKHYSTVHSSHGSSSLEGKSDDGFNTKKARNWTTKAPASSFQDKARIRTITQLTYFLRFVKGVVYPFFKVSLIAMAEKLLRVALERGIDPELSQRIEEEIFNNYASPITDAFLLRSLDFYGVFAVAASCVACVAVALPLPKALTSHYLTHMEVKRLQNVVYERFILEPNSVAIDEATDLLYTKIAAVEKYWEKTKFSKLDDLTTMVTGLSLIVILAWDIGLACLGATMVCVFVSAYMWKRLSTPWAKQREDKMVQANSHLIDVVVCKESVLTHAQELQEQERLIDLLNADEVEIKNLFRANFIAESFKTAFFTMITPFLFLFVFIFDANMNRVFQLLIMIVILDEIMKAFIFFSKHAEVEAEYARAKASFCHVLGMEEDVLFPSDFIWSLKSNTKTSTSTSHDDTCDPTGTDRDMLEMGLSAMNKSYDQLMADRSSRRLSLSKNTEDISELISQAFEEPDGHGELSLKNVSFGYKSREGAKSTVVKNLNMKLKIGEHYAIMGETGVGKSTLLKALSGLHEPLEGDIVFDGNAVDTTSVQWREQVAVVSQDSVFLNRSIRENLCYGLAATKSDEDILAALDKVKMKERILALPQGIDTEIEGNGNTFSGGQKQRLQIARLLLSSCPLVLLDECTSALDPSTTKDVLEILREFLVGKTMIMITHDADTLVLAQHVLEMKADRIVERTGGKDDVGSKAQKEIRPTSNF